MYPPGTLGRGVVYQRNDSDEGIPLRSRAVVGVGGQFNDEVLASCEFLDVTRNVWLAGGDRGRVLGGLQTHHPRPEGDAHWGLFPSGVQVTRLQRHATTLQRLEEATTGEIQDEVLDPRPPNYRGVCVAAHLESTDLRS